MAIVNNFEYFKPNSLDEALKLLSSYKGKLVRVLAGGTDLAVRIKKEIESPDVVIDIKGLNELKKIEVIGDKIYIGALVTFSELIDSRIIKEKLPMFEEMSKTVASMGVRNRATMVGNICSAVPSLDSGPALLVYDAEIIVKSSEGERTISIHNWFKGPKKTDLKENELVEKISITLPKKPYAGCYVKLGRYSGEDLAQAGIGLLALKDNEYRVAFCAVGPIPKRLDKIEKLLNNKEITETLIEEAKKILITEISPITDIRSTKEYRSEMMKVMFERGIKSAVSRLKGEKIDTHNILGG